MLEAFGWGFLGASSLLIGAAVVQVRAPQERTLGLVMAFGAGVLLSAVSFEMVDEAIRTADDDAAPVLGFFVGALVFVVGDSIVSRRGYEKRKSIRGDAPEASGPLIVLGIVLDGVPESAVIGLTVLESGTVGAGVLIAVFVSNLPEAVAATSSLQNSGWSSPRVFGLWGAIAVVSGMAAALGFGLLEDASANVIGFVNAFGGGAILAMLANTMMPEAHEHAGRDAGLATTFGFAVGYAVSYLT